MTYNEIHSYIYEYISTYQPTFSVTSTRESKNQIGMALPLPETSVLLTTVQWLRPLGVHLVETLG